jgi:hypothetical protein
MSMVPDYSIRINQLPFSATGGSMGPKYVLQLLFSEKLQNCYNFTTIEARE